jgi:hypothetical protein
MVWEPKQPRPCRHQRASTYGRETTKNHDRFAPAEEAARSCGSLVTRRCASTRLETCGSLECDFAPPRLLTVESTGPSVRTGRPLVSGQKVRLAPFGDHRLSADVRAPNMVRHKDRNGADCAFCPKMVREIGDSPECRQFHARNLIQCDGRCLRFGRPTRSDLHQKHQQAPLAIMLAP